MTMKKLYAASGASGILQYSLELHGEVTPEHILEDETFQRELDSLMHALRNAMMSAAYRTDPATQQHIVAQKVELLSCFESPIYVNEIPNGYSNGPYWELFPWFEVTTKVGIITIGWRKRVIEIDWEKTRGTKGSDALFRNEDVTKGDYMIHAWSVSDAKRYIHEIITNTTESA